MMTKNEALHFALVALKLEEAQTHYPTQSTVKAIATIKEALAQPEQEPVGKFAKFTDGIWREVTDGSAGVPLYTTPPQRTWVGLTDEEIDPDAEQSDNYAAFHGGVRFAETKLKEKNI